MDTSRRGVLRLFAGATAAATVSPREAAKALGMENALVAGSLGECMEQVPLGPTMLHNSALSQLRHLMYVKDEVHREASYGHFPPHISGKKSWSQVFKAGVHSQERLLMRAFINKLEEDEQFGGQILSVLGIAAE